MPNLKQVASEIAIRGRSEGVEELAQDLRDVADAGVPAARAIETTEKVTQSAERSFARLENRFDKVAAAERRRERDLKALARAQEAGVAVGQRYEDLQEAINADYDRQIDRLKRATREQDRYNDEAEEGARSLGLLGKAGASLQGVLAGALAGVSFAAIISGARDAAAEIDALAKKARSLGGIDTAGFLQESRFALGRFGFAEDQADQLLGDLSQRVGQFQLGTGELGQIALRIEGGAEFANALKNAKTLEQQFDIALKKLSEVEDASQRAALAGAVFGEEAAKNIGALAEAGVDGFKRTSAEAREAGVVLDEYLLVRAEELNDRFGDSSKIIDTQMRRAFLQIGPIVADIAEGVAGFVKGFADGVENLRFNLIKLKDIETVSEAEAAVAAFERQAAAVQNRIDEYSAAGITNTQLPLQLDKINEKLAAAEDHLNGLIASSVTLDDVLGAVGAGVAGGLNSSLEAAQKTRNALEKELAAAREGQAALEKYRRGRAIDKAVEDSGLVNQVDIDNFRRLQEEIVQTGDDVARLEQGFRDAGKAAAEVRFDPIGDIERENARLQTLVEAAALGEDELANARARLEIEDAIAKTVLDAGKAKVTLSEDQIAQLKKQLELNQTLQNTLDGGGDAGRPQFRDVGADLERELIYASDGFWNRFVRTGKFSFRDLALDFKTALLNAAIDPLRQIMSGLLGGGDASAGLLDGVNENFDRIAAGFEEMFRKTGKSLEGISESLGKTVQDFSKKLGVAVAGVSAGFAGFALGSGLADLINGRKGETGGKVGGAVGGAAGFAVGGPAGALVGSAAGGFFGDLIGGLSGNSSSKLAGAGVGFLVGGLGGAAIGAALGALFSKPSNKVGQAVFDPVTGKVLGVGQDKGGDQNLEIAKAVAGQVSDIVGQFAEIAGGSGARPINVEVGSRHGINVGFQGAQGQIVEGRNFENTEAGVKAAIEAGISLAISSLSGGGRLLGLAQDRLAGGDSVEDVLAAVQTLAPVFENLAQLGDKARANVETFIDKALDAGKSAEFIADRAGRLAAIFESNREPVDVFAQRVRDINETIPPLIADLKALGQATQDLETVQQDLLRQVGDDRNDLSRQQLLAVTSPLLAQAEAFIKAAAAERAGADEARAAGAPVDLALLDAAQRAQALAGFNLDARAAGSADPAAAQLRAVAENQTSELAAMRALLEAGFARQADLDRLEFAQAGERAAALRSLAPEDQLRLAGSDEFRDFETVSGRVGVLLTGIVNEMDRFENGLDDLLDTLRSDIADGERLVSDYDRALGRYAERGLPGERLDILRAQFTDTRDRALAGEVAARESLVGIGDRLRELTLRDNATSLAGQADLKLVEAGVRQVRDVVSTEVSDAQKRLDAANQTNDILADIRTLIAAGDYDPLALESLAAGIDLAEPVRRLALELAALKAQQAGVLDRAQAALAGASAEDVFRNLSLLIPANDAAARPAYVAAAERGTAGTYAPPASPPAANDSPVPLVTQASRAPSIAPPAASGSADDDLIAEIARQTNVLIDLYNLLTGQRTDHRKASTDIKAKLTDINNAQVAKAI